MLIPPVEAKKWEHTGIPERTATTSFTVTKNSIKQNREKASGKSDLNHIQKNQLKPWIMDLLVSAEKIGV